LFFFRLKLHGLGYRIKRLANNLFRFFIGTTNFLFFHVPVNVLVKARRRRILFLSPDFFVLRSVFTSLLLLKKLIPYQLRGIFFPKQIILMKPGKKRF
jgi:ribosomal protein L6P/L9E